MTADWVITTPLQMITQPLKLPKPLASTDNTYHITNINIAEANTNASTANTGCHAFSPKVF